MERAKSFEAKLARIMKAAQIEKEADLAKMLEINQSSIAAARKRQQIPPAWIEKIAEKLNINANWLFFGQGEMTFSKDINSCIIAKDCDVELKLIPMAEARLSAGNGSLEVNGDCERSYAFRMDFLLRKGNPDKMVLMRVAGDSMQPEIMDGDVVLLDQSKTNIIPGRIFAVGFEEAIYLKRIDMIPGKVILKSVNEEAYPPIELDMRGDMAEFFRVIGKVIWSGREYR
ncbi:MULTISPECIES: LexA family transcriptional regulator [unclassified Desulfovibrio]|uniref:LexA family transcriptional regulator n=1 Tax=unclassified Desulfovibrio TaxID=2593640 RepID=UPI0025FEADED|nr:S24 family peptidase [uncultured Desulfovibrio sp.]